MIDAKLSAKELIRQCESYPGDQRFLDAVVNVASFEGSPIHWKPFRSSCRLILASGITHDIKHFPSDFDLKNDPQWQAFSRQCRKDVAKCLADWLDDLDRKPTVDVDDVEQELQGKGRQLYRYLAQRAGLWVTVDELIHDGVFDADRKPESYRQAFKRLQSKLAVISPGLCLGTRNNGQEVRLEK